MTNLVTPAEVMALMGRSVGAADITRAQFYIALIVGVDLADDVVVEDLGISDVAILKQAIIWQVDFNEDHPDLAKRDPSVKSASTNGVSITYSDGQVNSLSPQAYMCLSRLSWRKNQPTIATLTVSTPYSEDRCLRQPDLWHRIA